MIVQPEPKLSLPAVAGKVNVVDVLTGYYGLTKFNLYGLVFLFVFETKEKPVNPGKSNNDGY